MNDFQDDEDLARLRAADPAQGAHPDLHAISERLRGRTPLGSGDRGHSSDSGFTLSATSDAVHVHDPGVRTGRGGLLVAASVAALALGGGGFAAGLSAGSDSDIPSPAAATDSARQQDESAAGTPEFLGAGESSADEAMGDEEMSAATDSGGGGNDGYYGPVIPVAGVDLSTERTTGTVFAPGSSETSGAADKLQPYAERLGIEGKVQDYESAADLTDSTDGRSLHLYLQSGVIALDYNNPALDAWCEQSMAEAKDQGYSWLGEGGPQDVECATLGEPPSEDAAITSAQDLLDRAGVDYAGYEFRVNPTYGDELDDAGEEPTDLSVIASDPDSPVGDFRTWQFSVTSAGVAYASVQLGDLVELGDYPVISAAEAVERANDTRFQQLGVYIPNLEYDAVYEEDWEEPDTLPAAEPGGRIPFPMGEATVTRAELHTGVLSLWEGSEYIVPAWNLTDDEGNSWQVLGLTEESLDFTP